MKRNNEAILKAAMTATKAAKKRVREAADNFENTEEFAGPPEWKVLSPLADRLENIEDELHDILTQSRELEEGGTTKLWEI